MCFFNLSYDDKDYAVFQYAFSMILKNLLHNGYKTENSEGGKKS